MQERIGLKPSSCQNLSPASIQIATLMGRDGFMPACRERRRKEQIRQERMGLKVLSSLGLTPGTSLMALIQQSLAFYICRSLDSERWQHIQWELSGANVQVRGHASPPLQRSRSPPTVDEKACLRSNLHILWARHHWRTSLLRG